MILRWAMALAFLLAGGLVPAAAQSTGEDPLPTLDELLDLPAPKGDGGGRAAPADSLEEAGSSGAGFSGVVEDLDLAAGRLSDDRDAGIATQRLQKRVIQRLDRLISQAAAQQASSSSKQKPRGQDTGSESAAQRRGAEAQQASRQGTDPARRGTRGRVEQEALGDEPLSENLAEWGNLPPHLRDALLEGRDDAYSRIWRRLTERYYKRLQEVSP